MCDGCAAAVIQGSWIGCGKLVFPQGSSVVCNTLRLHSSFNEEKFTQCDVALLGDVYFGTV
eukprot:1156665-Pelagomonas_calceolata.AAC.5